MTEIIMHNAERPVPMCFKCKKNMAGFLPAFQTFSAYKPHFPVALNTMDVAFCHACTLELTVNLLLTDSIWDQIVQQTHRDLNGKRNSQGVPVPAPKLDRGMTQLKWRPFATTKNLKGVSK